MDEVFNVKDFHVNIKDKEVVRGVTLQLKKGEISVIMGPNGAGKSSFANGLMGHPSYETKGNIVLDGEDISSLSADKRSKKGLFLSFQNPVEIPGVTVANFLRTAVNSRKEKGEKSNPLKFMKLINEKMELLHIPVSFSSRYINEGFSGGEKKKMEILQLAMLDPKVAILDETDSGLDIDALKKVCESINILKEQNKELTLLIITHYQKMLDYLKPDHVFIMLDGKIVKKGGGELVKQLEEEGYKAFR